MKNILWWLLFVFGVVATIYFIPQILTRTLNNENPTLTVISYSMYPALNRGDLILVRGTTFEEIEVGTVVVFRHEKGLAVHRVVEIEGDAIVTKGDANPEEDDPITYDDIVGRVPAIGDSLIKIPLVGRISLLTGPPPAEDSATTVSLLQQIGRYAWNPLGFSLLVLLPAVLFMSSISGDIMSALSPSRRRKQRRSKRLERLKKRWPRARIR
jgi:signal peptidase I